VSGLLRRVEDVAGLHAFLEKAGVDYVDRTSVAGVHQVLIRVRVAEVQRTALRVLAADVALGAKDGVFDPFRIGPAFSDTSTGTLNPTVRGVGAGAFTGELENAFVARVDIPEWKLSTFFQALQQNDYLRMLAEPSLKCVSGEEAQFLAGGEFPIPVLQGGNRDNNAGTSSITVVYKEFGVRLRFKPLVLGDNSIRLTVAPEVSELTQTGSVQLQGFSIPAILTRRAETTLELKSGQTFALAGLINQRVDARNARTPLLGDVPVLGALFRSVRYRQGETELVVMVTADLVEPLNPAGKTAVPGSTFVPPSDWELYGQGRLDGNPYPRLSDSDAAWLKESGLSRLRGPGAWSTHEQPPAQSTSSLRPEGAR
jgi:pilus assembly protein CpaC